MSVLGRGAMTSAVLMGAVLLLSTATASPAPNKLVETVMDTVGDAPQAPSVPAVPPAPALPDAQDLVLTVVATALDTVADAQQQLPDPGHLIDQAHEVGSAVEQTVLDTADGAASGLQTQDMAPAPQSTAPQPATSPLAVVAAAAVVAAGAIGATFFGF